jgi:hypothetical protein
VRRLFSQWLQTFAVMWLDFPGLPTTCTDQKTTRKNLLTCEFIEKFMCKAQILLHVPKTGFCMSLRVRLAASKRGFCDNSHYLYGIESKKKRVHNAANCQNWQKEKRNIRLCATAVSCSVDVNVDSLSTLRYCISLEPYLSVLEVQASTSNFC